MKISFIKDTPSTMDGTPTPQILGLLEHLSVEPWRCVAEFVDNALDDFRTNGQQDGNIEISCQNGCLIISDNGSGMSFPTLEKAIKAGYSSKPKHDELGLFGVGFNIACARLGRKATVWTKQGSDEYWLQVEVNVNELVKKDSFIIQPAFVNLDIEQKHGTIVSVVLRRPHLANFERTKYIQEIAEHLGRVYSYLLRENVPGLPDKVAGNPRNVTINVDSISVKPWMPCVWDEKRTVT